MFETKSWVHLSHLMEFGAYGSAANFVRLIDKVVLYCLLHTFHHLAYLFACLLTPWSRVLLEKLTGSQLLKKFPAFYRTRKLITAFTSGRQLSLS